jgi:anti-sigma B factor antagonist
VAVRGIKQWMTTDRPGAAETNFSLREERAGDSGVVVRLGGDVDLHTAPHVRERLTSLIDEGMTLIVVDLDEATFIDSMTLGVLLGASKRLRPRGGQLRVAVADANIRKIFEITLLDRIFPLYDSREAALADTGEGAG